MRSQRLAVITGGGGFIGSHLARRLHAAGWHVRVIDNESNGSRSNLPSAIDYIVGDVRDPLVLGGVFDGPVEAVFHLAAQVSSMRAILDPAEDAATNIVGTINVLLQCIKHRVPRLLHASSMALYGQTDGSAVSEETPCSPITCYGISKLAAENYVFASAMRTDLPVPLNVTAFRMFNVYGPGQSISNTDQGVLSVFIARVLRNEPVLVFGTGEQSRDFIYIDDVIDAWYGAIDNPGSYGRVLNLGTGISQTINKVLDDILYSQHRKRDEYQVIHMPEIPGDQFNVRANSRLAMSVLNWNPRITFQDGLASTISWAVSQGG